VDFLSLLSVVCCQVEVSLSGRLPVQRRSTACSVSECNCVASTMRRPWPKSGCRTMEKKKSYKECKNGGS